MGRARECQRLGELLGTVRRGTSAVLVLHGEPGMGKSALLHHLEAAAADFTVLRAVGVESEMELAFAALHQLCAPLFELLSVLPPPQREAAEAAFGLARGTTPDRLLIGLAMLNLLSAAAERGPVLCVVDDAHWLDQESLQVIAFLARRLLADPIGVVFATRPGNPAVTDLPEMQVGPLADAEARALLDAVLYVPVDEAVLTRVVAETHGNPLALTDWPRSLSSVRPVDRFELPASMGAPERLDGQFELRLSELPAPSRMLLVVAAAEPTGDAVLLWHAAELLGLGPADGQPAVDAGLLELDASVRFRHPIIRSVAYHSAAPNDRQAAHRALAEVTDPNLDPDRNAWHRALGSPSPDDEIADALERSAARAQSRGGVVAVAALLERSALLSLDPPTRVRRLLNAAAAHQAAGSLDHAAKLLSAVVNGAGDQRQRAELDMLRARLGMFAGSPDSSVGPMLDAARRLEVVDPSAAVPLYLDALLSACQVGVMASGVDLMEVARHARSVAAPQPESPAWRVLVGLASASVDGQVQAAPRLREIVADGSRWGGTDTFNLIGAKCAAATAVWDIDGFRRVATVQIQMMRDAGALSALPAALNALAQVLVLEGDLDDALATVSEAAEISEMIGNRLPASVAALHAGLVGSQSADAVIESQIELGEALGLGLTIRSALWARATLANGRGHFTDAFDAGTAAMRQRWEWSGHLFFHELIEPAARLGRLDVAAPTLAVLEATIDGSGNDWSLGMWSRSRALLAAGDEADELYRQAIDHLERTTLRPETARAHLLYGEWLRREHRRTDARNHLRSAHEMFTSMGIKGFAARAKGELLATGEAAPAQPERAFDGLTPQEARIARLAAEGSTNAEIGSQLYISHRTVEYHLHKVFTKLGVSSRRELSRSGGEPT